MTPQDCHPRAETMQALSHLQAPHPHPTPTPLPPPPHTLTAFDCSHPRQVLLGDGETHTRGWPSTTKLAAFLQPLGTRVVGLGRRFSRSSQTARELKVSSTGPAAAQTHPATSRPDREAPHFSPPPPHTRLHCQEACSARPHGPRVLAWIPFENKLPSCS